MFSLPAMFGKSDSFYVSLVHVPLAHVLSVQYTPLVQSAEVALNSATARSKLLKSEHIKQKEYC